MRVPITALMRATIADTTTVTRSDARATGEVTADQNPPIPSSNAVTVSAARGSSTMTLNHSVATPMPSGPTVPVTVSSFLRAGRAGAGDTLSPPPAAVAVVIVTVTSSRCRRRERWSRRPSRTGPRPPSTNRRDRDLEGDRRGDVLHRIAAAFDEQRLVFVAE